MTEQQQTILITGGAGFIGSHVVERLLAAGYAVVNLDLLTYAGNPENLAAVADHARYTFAHGDIGDRALVRDLLSRHRPSVVFNLAAESHVDRSIDSAAAFIETNVAGVHRLLESCLEYWNGLAPAARGRFRYIQMSTDEVYGSTADDRFVENSPYAPNSPYAASKASGDHFVRAFNVTHGLPTLIARASNTYGARQFPEKLIPHMLICALNGRQLPVYGQGLNVREWMFVDDLAAGLLRVVEAGKPGESYNFASGEEWKNIDTVRAICGLLDRHAPGDRPHDTRIHFVTDRPGHDLRYALRTDKVKDELGWVARTAFADGLASTVGWYLANRDWWLRILDGGYRGGRIGLSGG